MTPSNWSPTAMGTASIDSSTSSVPGIWTANVDLARVRRDERPAGLRDAAGDAFADLGDQRLDGVLLVVGEHLAAERDRIERPAVGLQEVHAAAVIGDDRAQLRGDGRADLDRVVRAS